MRKLKIETAGKAINRALAFFRVGLNEGETGIEQAERPAGGVFHLFLA